MDEVHEQIKRAGSGEMM